MISSAGSCAMSSRGTFDSPLAAMARMRGAMATSAAGSVWCRRSWTRNAPWSDSIIGGQRRAVTRMSTGSSAEELGAGIVSSFGSMHGNEVVVPKALVDPAGIEEADLEAGPVDALVFDGGVLHR